MDLAFILLCNNVIILLMPFLADLHVHSKYSRATSQDMCPEGLWRGAQLKGISVIGTGDFTHPAYLAELNGKLEPLGNGLFALKRSSQQGEVPSSCLAEVSFILSAEISCIYSKNGRTRKVHNLVLMPDLPSAERLNASLARIGNLRSDGRPILGLDAKELLRLTLDASPDALFIPAHAWTPHFSVFGAASGFDSLEECFGELTPHIHAIETGLSSDPAMNRRLSVLDRITLVSNSDAHSAAKLGREANVIEAERSYGGIRDAIVTGKGFLGTIEFFPEEGKYHADGHRACGVRLSPEETMRNKGRCPECGGKVTVGVLHRVAALADRPEGSLPHGAPGFTSIIPLTEIIAEVLGCGVNTKKVDALYRKLLAGLGPEFTVLRDVPIADIERAAGPLPAEAVRRMRSGQVHIEPGYDGEYGKIRIFDDSERLTRPRGRSSTMVVAL
jgi:uncharacterized protein (TIGR00375 family)